MKYTPNPNTKCTCSNPNHHATWDLEPNKIIKSLTNVFKKQSIDYLTPNAYEFIIVFGEKLKSNTTYTKNHITTSVTKMPKEHKAVMNDCVARYIIENFTNDNDIIYDPFMGTGTTAKIAKSCDRNYIGSEIVKEYCALAEDKLANIQMPLSCT